MLYVLLRVVRSPFGHVLVAIRENQLRATFQGYPVERYKLAVFVISAVVTGLAGALLGFQNYLVSAEAVSVPFAGELLAMVVIGGMRSILGPALGALFFILFRELFSIWTANWLLWFGLIFVAFVMFSPDGLVGIWKQVLRRLRPPPEEAAAMSKRKIYNDLPLPSYLAPQGGVGTVLEVKGVSKQFGGIRAVTGCEPQSRRRRDPCPDRPERRRQDHAVQSRLRPVPDRQRNDPAAWPRNPGRAVGGDLPSGSGALVPDHQPVSRALDLRKPAPVAAGAAAMAASTSGATSTALPNIHAETAELVKFLGLEGIETIEGGELSYGGQRLVDLGIALGSKPQVLLLDEPLAGLAAAERERVSNLVQNIAANIPVLIVEHDIDRVLAFSRTVTVMNQGEVLMSDTPEAVRADRRVQEIYTGKGIPEVTHQRSDDARADAAPLLRFERVNTFYGKSHILHDATLDVRDGEIVALLGRNGAGKSTLLKTLAGLVPAASGAIEYQGRDIAKLPAPDIARLGIGYVPQGRGLFAGLTVRENLALGRLARKTDGSNGVVWDEAQILDHFPRLKERMDVAADYLSGGEQQMVAVARAMSGNVKLLLLDEPFEGLAPAVTLELFGVFDRLRRHIGIVIVEHNLDLVLALADRVFALERGAVFHQGPGAAAVDRSRLSQENPVAVICGGFDATARDDVGGV